MAVQFPSPSGSSFRALPTVRVVLHHNPAMELMGVVRIIMDLTRFCREEATHRMWESYHCGRSVLLTTHLERAELYVEQFQRCGIQASIEAGA